MADQMTTNTALTWFAEAVDARIDKALKKLVYPKYKYGTVTAVDDIKQTASVRMAGQTTITTGYPNYTRTVLNVGDTVAIMSMDGKKYDCSNAFVAEKLGSTPPRIGYAGCYITYNNGLTVTNEAKTLKLVANADDCFALYTGDGSGTNWTLAAELTADGLQASRISTVGSPVYLMAGNIGPDGDFLGMQLMHGGTGDTNELLGVGYLTNPTMGLSLTHKGIRWAQVLDDDTLIGANIDQSNPTYTWYNGTDAGMVVNATTTMRSNPTQFSIYTDFYCSKTKSCIQTTQDYGDRALYTVEAPDNRFVDYGRGTLVNGECMITIDPIFVQCFSDNSDYPYDVMLTKYGQGDIWVDSDSMTADSFTVKGTADISFCYEIVGHRRGFEDVRFKIMD